MNKQAKLDGMAPSLLNWRVPGLLYTAIQLQVDSSEVAVQASRLANAVPSNEQDLAFHPNPTPLSALEVNMEEIAQKTSKSALIPFFIPTVTAPAPLPLPAAIPPPAPPALPISLIPNAPPILPTISPPVVAPAYGNFGQSMYDTNLTGTSFHTSTNTGASLEYLQAMGLPYFLEGFDMKALQTVASTPGLLQTFANSNGEYDEARLSNLVHTLTQNPSVKHPSVPAPVSNPVPPAPTPFSGFTPQPAFQVPPPASQFFPPPPPQAPPSTNGFNLFGLTPPTQSLQTKFVKGAYRGDQNTTDGNLHVSGYGPGATQDEIYALFSQYVQILELVPKGTFCFINTNDSEGARRAREALQGFLVGGSPIRINLAVRKDRDPNKMRTTKAFGFETQTQSVPSVTNIPVNKASATQNYMDNTQNYLDNTQNYLDNIRDDRGNPATKNLFVAGYGPGTTEHQVRQVFNQFGEVTGTVMKPSYAFVNMSNRESAIAARQALMGKPLNGSPLRVNFAKESGRLGTSFDHTYNSSSYGTAQTRSFV